MFDRLNEDSNCDLLKNEPNWFGDYRSKLLKEDILKEIRILGGLGKADVEARLGGKIEDLDYATLSTLFIDGSDDPAVGEILRSKRTIYLRQHPEMSRGVPGAMEGIIGFDGRVIPIEKWRTATDSEKRGFLVGSTCFHYNSDTPGMGSDPKDRF